jgi:hypothetical protein
MYAVQNVVRLFFQIGFGGKSSSHPALSELQLGLDIAELCQV